MGAISVTSRQNRVTRGVESVLVTRDRAWLHRNLRQFLKFAVVGGSGVVVNLLVGILLHRANGGTINAGDPLFTLPGTEDPLAGTEENIAQIEQTAAAEAASLR